ncbi:MAG TPA: DUF5777 family beta-barrel protein [Vicinamibacterales bacterium]|nr:DUF5777 family beta-barrel protein [Vicinamibacterales bacterium]
MWTLDVHPWHPAILSVLLVLVPATCSPQTVQTPPDPPPQPGPAVADVELNLIGLPTTRPVQRHRSYFRLTHRFARDLRRGDFGSLVEDLFALDNGAVLGLEYRYGITGSLQAGVHRTSLSKTIQFFGRFDGWRQSERMPIAVSLLGSVEGLDNFQDDFQPALGATVARALGRHVALYATPMAVWNTRAAEFLDDGHDHDHDLPGAGEDEHSGHEHTVFVGLGARVRLRPTAFLVGEYSPRLAGHDPNRAVWGVAIEKYTRGHTLQLNFTNSFGTTFGQLARGGSDHDVYLGFNITRKF